MTTSSRRLVNRGATTAPTCLRWSDLCNIDTRMPITARMLLRPQSAGVVIWWCGRPGQGPAAPSSSSLLRLRPLEWRAALSGPDYVTPALSILDEGTEKAHTSATRSFRTAAGPAARQNSLAGADNTYAVYAGLMLIRLESREKQR